MTTARAGEPDGTTAAADVCPWCEQPIPPEQSARIRRRIRVNEQAQVRRIERRLRDEQAASLARSRADAEQQVLQAQERFQAQTTAAVAETEAALMQRLDEQRHALQKATADAIRSERAKAFEDRQKLEARLTQLQRQLAGRADSAGEGADVDLFEELRAEFPTDRIGRVKTGQPGADIVQIVVENGRECGTIVYDSKDRGSWRRSYLARLLEDKVAAKADHAVLLTRVFPAGHAQLFVQDGVIVVNPARATALAQVIRKHVVQLATLRVGARARGANTSRLYDFITSDRFGVLLEQISTVTDRLLELDVAEHRAHTATWRQRGRLLREVQQARGTLVTEIDLIVTAPDARPKEPR